MNHELINRIITSAILLPLLLFCIHRSGFYLITFLALVYFASLYEIIKNTKNLLFVLTSNIILVFALYSFYYLRGNTNESLITIYWILSATFLSDIGGYTFGKIFKGKKLTKISPSKTYSGSIGSVLLSSLSLCIVSTIQEFIYSENYINFYQIKFFILTILISIICQTGDLCVSFLKRKINIKNISNILPGHGGVLDRIDGLIFVLIFSFFIKNVGLI